MKVVEIVTIKGRGKTLVVDRLSEGVNEGSVVRQGDHRWLVCGVGHFAIPRERIVANGWSADLLVRPIADAPALPELNSELIRDVL